MTGDTSVLNEVADELATRATETVLEEWTIGQHQVLVELAHPTHGPLAGIALMPSGERSVDPIEDPMDLISKVTDPTNTASLIDRALGIATLNALSVPDIDWQAGDPMNLVPPDVTTIAMVGLFRPVVHKFDDHDLRIVERESAAVSSLPKDRRARWFTPDEARQAFADADICFMTGSTLIFGGFDAYVQALQLEEVTTVALIGATASMLPEPFFRRGVDVVAGVRVDDVAAVRTGIAEGACAADLHDRGLFKGYVVGDRDPLAQDSGRGIQRRGQP